MTSIRCIQVNLHHAKGASSVLSRRFVKEQIGIALVQEPWVNHNKVFGLTSQDRSLIYCNTQATPRTAILLSGNIKFTPITEFIQRDIVAALVTVPTTRGKQELVVASAYFPGDQEDIPPPEVAALVRYCRAVNKPFLIGCDANAHHTIWGSTDVNDRGEHLLEYLSSNDVNVCNKGNEPTFVTVARQEVLDLTLCSAAFADKIRNWHVSGEASLSDHRQIVFDIEAGQFQRETYRDPKDTDWDAFRGHLTRSKPEAPPRLRTPEDLDTAADTLQRRITAAYQVSCPKKVRVICRDVPWWSESLSNLRKEARRLFNRAKLTSNWDAYKAALTRYNAELRKAKKTSLANFCEDISSVSEATRLQKALSSDHSNGLGQVRDEQGALTVTNKETLQVLMSTHFPESTERGDDAATWTEEGLRCRPSRESVQLARRMFNQSSIRWALGTFEPLKAAGPDGILPIFLQKAADTIMAELINLLRASFTLGYIPRSWRKVKVIFIPKAGRSDPTMPKTFRPISLTVTLLKLMEKITDNHIRAEFLKDFPLHKHQYAYQAGKSTETALYI